MPGLILAIECAVAAGSLAILDGTALVAKCDASRFSPSRAEEILLAVESLINDAGTSLDQIDSIAVSTGPGSYSGIRIGISTAVGLRTALGIPCVGVPVLAAMALAARSEEIIAAIPVGKNDVAWQVFPEAGESGTAQLTPQADFVTRTEEHPSRTVFCHTELFTRLGGQNRPQFMDAGSDLAVMVGHAAAAGRASGEPEPIYLRNAAHKSGF